MSPPHSIPLTQNFNIVSKVLFESCAKALLRDIGKSVADHDEYAEDYGYSSDSDLEDDEDEKVTLPKRQSKSKVHPFDSYGISDEGGRTPCEEHVEHTEEGKIVKIPDMAFVT